MPYPALTAARRRHYEIDGTVCGYNTSAYGSGLTTQLSAASMLALNEETPSVNTIIFSANNISSFFFYMLFPEAVDLSFFVTRWILAGSPVGLTFANLQSSTDTTNGTDGTWNTVGTSGTPMLSLVTGPFSSDWWRANPPATLTSNNTNLKGLRFQVNASNLFGSGPGVQIYNVYVWGTKHSGATPDDIIFLESDATTEWPHDDDWGDINAGAAAVTHTYYVKNTSATKTANTITVKASGSDNGQWTVSLDNVSFASSKSISSIAPGATQVVYFKFTPPSPASGVYRPYAAYLEADVTNWT